MVWTDEVRKYRKGWQDAHPFSFPSVSLLSSLVQQLCAGRAGPGMGWGEGQRAMARRTLLTNGPGVCRLREVLGHLPVDVKPAESKGDRGEVGTRGQVSGSRGDGVSRHATWSVSHSSSQNQLLPLFQATSLGRPPGHPSKGTLPHLPIVLPHNT